MNHAYVREAIFGMETACPDILSVVNPGVTGRWEAVTVLKHRAKELAYEYVTAPRNGSRTNPNKKECLV